MLLIDALFLNSPGGITLLKYLYKNLEKHEINCFFLLDKRSENDLTSWLAYEKTFIESNLKNRKQFYLLNRNNFSRVLCFCNIPPPVPLSVPVLTFFQNVNILQDCSFYPIRSRVLHYLKRKFIFHYRANTNTWIVQTRFMKHLLIKRLGISDKYIEVLPFFDMADQEEAIITVKKPGSFLYPSTGLGHKNHLALLKAWELLHQENRDFELHLTIPTTDLKLTKLIAELKSKGLKIINHGIIEKSELLALYQATEYVVYPSLNESFGLPLVEAVQQNCKIIAADLPYSKETIIPTTKFDPYQPNSLKNAIIEATLQMGNEKKSEIIIENKIDSLIALLNTSVNSC